MPVTSNQVDASRKYELALRFMAMFSVLTAFSALEIYLYERRHKTGSVVAYSINATFTFLLFIAYTRLMRRLERADVSSYASNIVNALDSGTFCLAAVAAPASLVSLGNRHYVSAEFEGGVAAAASLIYAINYLVKRCAMPTASSISIANAAIHKVPGNLQLPLSGVNIASASCLSVYAVFSARQQDYGSVAGQGVSAIYTLILGARLLYEKITSSGWRASNDLFEFMRYFAGAAGLFMLINSLMSHLNHEPKQRVLIELMTGSALSVTSFIITMLIRCYPYHQLEEDEESLISESRSSTPSL